MSSSVTHHKEHFLDSDDQYLVVIASCLTKRIEKQKEPILASVINRYPYANIYDNSERKRAGSFMIVGDGLKKRKIIVIFSQIYPTKMSSSPMDNENKRLTWFIQALNGIAEIDDLKSITFPSQISRDGGGSWSRYYTAIKDFANTLHLKTSIKVNIYENESDRQDDSIKQISLLNCVNLDSALSLESICYAYDTEKVKIVKDHLSFAPKRKKLQLNFNKLKRKITIPTKKDSKKEHLVLDDDENNLDDENNKSQNEVDEAGLISDDEQEVLEIDNGNVVELKEDDELPKFPMTKHNPDWTTDKKLTDPIVDQTWKEFFQHPEIQEKLADTHRSLVKELDKHGQVSQMLPAYDLIFNAFILCPYDKLKVVILGQDPYPNPKHAMGLSFSVPEGERVAMSLKNIFKEILRNYPDNYVIPKHGNLESWAKQGVLLLNSALSLRAGARNSHQSYWKSTTDLIIQEISRKAAAEGRTLIFMLWGGDAKKKKKLIDTKKHMVLESGHPSPMSIKFFEGCGHFKTCNQKLKSIGQDLIDWQT